MDIRTADVEDSGDLAVMEAIARGELIEDESKLTGRYRAVIEQTLYIAAMSEVTVLTWAHTAFATCPDLGAKIAVASSIQDEVGHAHQQGALYEQFGHSINDMVFSTPPERYKTLMIMEFPVRNYIEFVVAQALLDRAGRFTTKDIELHCSFAPYRRTLRKVNFEEAFHVHHGAYWTEYYWNHSEETRQAVQDAVDWLFPHGTVWFGVPDHLKRRTDQLAFGIRRWSNDTMRQMWLKSTVEFAGKVGFKVPAHFDEQSKEYVIDCPYPMKLNEERTGWSGEACTWDEAVAMLKGGGPMRPSAYERIQGEVWGARLWAA